MVPQYPQRRIGRLSEPDRKDLEQTDADRFDAHPKRGRRARRRRHVRNRPGAIVASGARQPRGENRFRLPRRPRRPGHRASFSGVRRIIAQHRQHAPDPPRPLRRNGVDAIHRRERRCLGGAYVQPRKRLDRHCSGKSLRILRRAEVFPTHGAGIDLRRRVGDDADHLVDRAQGAFADRATDRGTQGGQGNGRSRQSLQEHFPFQHVA